MRRCEKSAPARAFTSASCEASAAPRAAARSRTVPTTRAASRMACTKGADSPGAFAAASR